MSSAHSKASTTAPNSGESLPSDGLRSTISFILFVHLFLLGAAVVGNLPPTSPLRTQLGEIPGLRHYTELLAMDSGYNYHLTYGLSEDTPQFLEVVPPAGESGEPLIFSPENLSPGFRKAHYRNLLLEASIRADRQLSEGLLPQRIADYVLRANDKYSPITDLYLVQLRRRNLLSQDLAKSKNPKDNNPLDSRWLQTSYRVNVWYADGKLQVIEAPSALESATIRTEEPEPQPEN